MDARPTRLFKLVSITLTIDGYHDTYGFMCGSVVLPGTTEVTKFLQWKPITYLLSPDLSDVHPIIW